MILKCTCSHEFQDRTYGKGNRVHNEQKGASARCTVCGNSKGITKGVKKK